MTNFRATSKTLAQENLELKNIDCEKHGINIALKNMSAFREFKY